MSLDPFASIPEHPARPAEERPELERKGTKIPLTGEGVKKRRHHDYESDSRKMWRERGYLYDKCSYKQQYTNKSHDLFGFGDGIAIGNGELVIVQTTSKKAKSAHITKILTEDWSIGAGYKFTILDAVVRALNLPNVRVVLCCWEQPGGKGTKWVCEETEVTEELLYEWKSRRDRRAS